MDTDTVVTKKDSKQMKYLQQAVRLLEKKGYSDIKAELPDYESPTSFTEKNSDKSYTPDLTGEKDMGKDYFQVVEGDKKNIQDVVSKWKLFSNLAKIKNGQFYLLVPYGKKKYTTELMREYNIDAELMKLER
ncbi:hypothetical protein PZB74_12235 [Porifericola rhodea]|uniref:hypothetical protein n=1 Tax=Porifericola rhodea TaxID=930972 RepID=UPI00266622BF|nr:hypothetical protein [Porifericola rhodea]WKN29736.1 hypothetical protein PZB74_12235 [Porifericola rhodea]